MNLTQLKYFQAVCQYGTVTQASQVLHITQPSISSAIRELEEEFGVILFKRHYRGMTLTPEGEKLLTLAGKLLEDADSLCQVMDDIGKKRHLLRLGVPPMIGSLLLPTIFQEFFLARPDIQLQILESGRQDLLYRIQSDELDLAFLPHSGLLEPEFHSVPVGTLETVCCVSDRHRLAGQNRVRIQELSEEKLVLFKDSFFQTAMIMARFSQIQQTPRVILQTSQLSTVTSMISSGMVIGFLFQELLGQPEASAGITSVLLDPRMPVQVSLVWRAGSFPFQDRTDFIQYVKERPPVNDLPSPGRKA